MKSCVGCKVDTQQDQVELIGNLTVHNVKSTASDRLISDSRRHMDVESCVGSKVDTQQEDQVEQICFPTTKPTPSNQFHTVYYNTIYHTCTGMMSHQPACPSSSPTTASPSQASVVWNPLRWRIMYITSSAELDIQLPTRHKQICDASMQKRTVIPDIC